MKKVKNNSSYKSRKSRSHEDMRLVDSSKIPQRQASTPTHELSILPASPDISAVSVVGRNKSSMRRVKTAVKLENQGTTIGGLNSSKRLVGPKTVTKKTAEVSSNKIDLEQKLDFEYTEYLQAILRRKLEERKCEEIDEELTQLQKRLTENQRILSSTSSRLKNIQFNKEIDFLHSLHSANFGKVLETVDEVNCEEKLITLNEKLEQARHQLRVKMVEISSTEQLSQNIADTVSAFEKFRADTDLETAKALTEISKEKKDTSNNLMKTVKNLQVNEELLLTRTTLEISAKDILAQNESLNQESQDFSQDENLEDQNSPFVCPSNQSFCGQDVIANPQSPTVSEIDTLFKKL